MDPGYTDALAAAAASAAAKSAAGYSGTDPIAGDPAGLVPTATGPGPDLTTRYLGLMLPTPVVASSGPLQQTVDGIRALADSGVGAVVMYSLFEEQIRYESERAQQIQEAHAHSFAEAMTYFPTVASAEVGRSKAYLGLLEDAAGVVDIPLIASINGATTGGWVRTARQMQDAGAAAIELNIYYVPGDVQVSGAEVEQRHLDILAGVKDAVSVPVALKLGPYFSSFGDLALRLDAAGADALVLFNRFLQPDIDLATTQVRSSMALSAPLEGRLPRNWIAVLRGKVKASLALTSGVETADDVIKAILAGADVVMTTSALLRHGPGYVAELLEGLSDYLSRHELTLTAARGMLAVPADAEADVYERSGYLSAIEKAKRQYGQYA